MAQWLDCFCWGGASLADAERLNDEPLVCPLARVEKFADQTQRGQWLRHQSDASLAALWQLIAEFVTWVIARADAACWSYAGRAEVFFDDPQIEVFGPSSVGAKIHYEGNLRSPGRPSGSAPSWSGGELGSPGDVSGALP